jgi:hypothetical protein
MFMGRSLFIVACILLFCSLAPAQGPLGQQSKQLPCEFKGDILQSDGEPLWLTSDEMKKRALQKVDVGPLAKNADIKAVVIASVLVDNAGGVQCLKVLNPQHPLVVAPTLEALKQWKFKPMRKKGRLVAYVGWLEFQFCRIGCPEGKSSVTLLE